MIPLLYQWKIIKTEAEQKEWARRFSEAMKVSDTSRIDPVSAKQQHIEAEKEVDVQWNKKFGGRKQ
jgi:hypothetical protein